MLTSFDPARGIEIVVGGHLPDAIEALTALGRLDEAERLSGALECGGRERNRAWMRAVGARGRAMWLAARGELAQAEVVAAQALLHHASLPMPFERARTQLLLGQLQQRLRRRKSALDNLEEAADVFETLEAALWVKRSRAALARGDNAPRRPLMLTAAERRIADLVMSGMTSREIAAQLFISPKTVESNLTRIYRKLGIRSRAQLHSVLREAE
jgi:DNA-binding CsgD family transcriptional regulator